MRRTAPLALLSFLVFGACAPEEASLKGAAGDLSPIDGLPGKADRWNDENSPDRFEGTFHAVLADLPTEGHAAVDAWPSTYWPTYQDSINHRWQRGVLSPAEKYDRAFNGWIPPAGFMDLRPFEAGKSAPGQWDPAYYQGLGPLASYISVYEQRGRTLDGTLVKVTKGNLHARDGVDSDGDGQVDELDDHDGVATWWGLCHAWVPASILEDRPLHAVTHKGVRFEVADLEALLIAAYDRTPSYGIGGRCNDGSPDEESPVDRDPHGRATNVQCRDTNAGTYHVVLANYLGRQGRPFAEDVTFDFEVWNQPLVRYEVTKMEKVSVYRAHQLLNYNVNNCIDPEGKWIPGCTYGGNGKYAYNPDAAALYDVHLRTGYVTESSPGTVPADTELHTVDQSYTYILETDSSGKVIGGEWYGDSRQDHPDFLWSPKRLEASSMPYLDLGQVRLLVQKSREPLPGVPRVYEMSPHRPIPDADPSWIESRITVPESLAASSVRVRTAIDHSYRGDLQVVLRHGGTDVVLHNTQGGAADDLLLDLVLSDYHGMDAKGRWSLFVRDIYTGDTGVLESWSLTFP
ncbi:MAG: proprotein convertase P-domain-containing protein [Myxococcales bacterium]|nr:proprotein convertase P-domain-containing protein [Myxococcales bacterium]